MISVVINTYNAEKYLKQCLESVKQADEIIVCDMFSTDNTINIANDYGCKIYYYEQVGYVEPARNYAISKAIHDWILVLDSDEIISEKLWKYLVQHTRKNNPEEVVRIARSNVAWGRPLNVIYPDYITRFFRSRAVIWSDKIHSTPEAVKTVAFHYINAKDKELSIYHNYSDSIESYLNKHNKYTSIEADARSTDYNITYIKFIYMTWKCFFLILEKYTLKKGYKDGVNGIIYCVLAGYYKFITYAKLWEKKNS